MRGRFVLPALCVSIGFPAFAASPDIESGGPVSAESVRMSCVGAMITADLPPPGGPIMANGTIDFARQSVRGFGVGNHPILVLTASHISFGSAPPEGAWHGNIVEGTIDRRSGETRVIVRSPKDPTGFRIQVDLDCEFEQPVS